MSEGTGKNGINETYLVADQPGTCRQGGAPAALCKSLLRSSKGEYKRLLTFSLIFFIKLLLSLLQSFLKYST